MFRIVFYQLCCLLIGYIVCQKKNKKSILCTLDFEIPIAFIVQISLLLIGQIFFNRYLD